MHARVMTTQIQPPKIDEEIRIYRESVVPAARQQRGFKGGLLLTDRAAGKSVSIALWETETDMKTTETGGYLQEQIGKFGALFAAAPDRESFEVSVKEL